GTDQLGRDVLSNLLYGFRTALQISVPVMVLAIITGIGAGSAAAYFGNHKIKLSRAGIFSFCGWLPATFFYAYYQRQPLYKAPETPAIVFISGIGWVLSLALLAYATAKALKMLPFFRKKHPFPLDEIILTLLEFLTSV